MKQIVYYLTRSQETWDLHFLLHRLLLLFYQVLNYVRIHELLRLPVKYNIIIYKLFCKRWNGWCWSPFTRTSISFRIFCMGTTRSSTEFVSFLISDSLSIGSVFGRSVRSVARFRVFLMVASSLLRFDSNSAIRSGQSKFSCGSHVFSELRFKSLIRDQLYLLVWMTTRNLTPENLSTSRSTLYHHFVHENQVFFQLWTLVQLARLPLIALIN